MRDMVAELTPRAFTVSEYHRMAAAGILEDDERVELLDGLIVDMPPIGLPHWSRHNSIHRYLIVTLGDRALVSGHISLTLGDRDEPQPDLAILASEEYERRGAPPEPAEVYAVIEIADASLRRDTVTKRALYARFEIADYLIADLGANALLHFSGPHGCDYPEPRRLTYGDTFALRALPGVALAADPFLRPPDAAATPTR